MFELLFKDMLKPNKFFVSASYKFSRQKLIIYLFAFPPYVSHDPQLLNVITHIRSAFIPSRS